jgi:hypothetical protein
MTDAWKPLYAMVWLVFLQFVMIIIPRFTPRLVDVHLLLGLIILGLAHYNNALLKKTNAPNRLKRIVKVTAVLATIQLLLGIILFANLRLGLSFPLVGVVVFIHLVTALAIITQASSVATAYDMWKEHEFATPVKAAA